MKREIIKIDEEKCNGCGLCVPACAEGALKIINGKAKLVNEIYCDGLGACLGECPQGAITMETREAKDFDEEAVKVHLDNIKSSHLEEPMTGCPGSRLLTYEADPVESDFSERQTWQKSELRQWPIQFKLIPPKAPFLEDTDLLIAADCVPFAYGDFHNQLLKGKKIIIACPKLDDYRFYQEKMTEVFQHTTPKSVTVAVMEVPCCSGLYRLVENAIQISGKSIPLDTVTVSIKGEIIKLSPKPHLIQH